MSKSRYNFKQVVQPTAKSPKLHKKIVLRSVRLRPSGISISKDIVSRMFPVYSIAERLYIKIEMDTEKKVIRISPDIKGYSFQVWPSGHASLSTLPVDIKRSDMPLGDYKTCNQNNVFKFVG